MRFSPHRRLALLVSLVLVPNAVSGIAALEGRRDEIIRQGVGLAFNGHYQEALGEFRKLRTLDIKDPAGTFFQAATLHAKMMDYEAELWREEFLALLDTTESLASEEIQRNTTNAWARFYRGCAYSYRAIFEARSGNWWAGFKYGRRAKSELEKTVKQDSTLYDAYLGLGAYDYWRSVKTKFLWWLPFVGDRRTRGIEQVQLAAERGIYFQEVAQNSLVWIYIEEEEYNQAHHLAQQLCKRFPESRVFLWGMAATLVGQKRWEKAIESYEAILRSVESETLDNHYNAIECHYWIATSYFELGKYGNCLQHCRKALSYKLDHETRKRIKSRLQEILDLFITVQRKAEATMTRKEGDKCVG